jgi:hypothetical protein
VRALASRPAEVTVDLSDGWMNTQKFEDALLSAPALFVTPRTSVVIRIGTNCRLMIDVVTRLLSLCNQLIAADQSVRLEFSGGQTATGYLDRIGFFDGLSRNVEVWPSRPRFSAAHVYRGGNAGLIEIERFTTSSSLDRALAQRLAHAVERNCAGRADIKAIEGAIGTIFGELINNVCEHSASTLDAFAALQTYRGGNSLVVSVSDSGIGILESLRPALLKRHDPIAFKSDVDLVVELFRRGVSRLDDTKRGCGLPACASHAVKFGADLDIRLARQRVFLRPSGSDYAPNLAYTHDGLSLLSGTHLSFTLKLA